MKGYQVATAVLAVLLVIAVGALFYAMADRESGGGTPAETAEAPLVTVDRPVQQVSGAPAAAGAPAADDRGEALAEEDDAAEACHHCGGAGFLPCGVCGGDGLMPYDCPRCGGSGMVRPSPVDPMLVRCSDCGGTGSLTVPCTNCSGDGVVRCSHCGGSGLEP
jgi:DnaJ-class molecular chaperone